MHRCGSAPLHLCTCSNQYTLDFLCLQLGCTPAPTHPATAGEKGAATAGATFCPEADLSRLTVDRAVLLKKIKAGKALGDNELECVSLGLVRLNAAAGATLCPEGDLSRLRVDRAAMLEKIKARKALSDDEWECVRLGITERSMRRTSNRTLCLCMSRALQPPSTLEKGRELGRCVQL